MSIELFLALTTLFHLLHMSTIHGFTRILNKFFDY